MKKTFLLSILCITAFFTQAQDSKFDFRFGTGWTFTNSGDDYFIMIENEVNYKATPYFAFSGSLGFGQNTQVGATTNTYGSFYQVNTNAYFSPFKNNKQNDFRLGVGLGHIWERSGNYYYSPSPSDQPVLDYAKNNFVANFILENTYQLNDRFSLGAKIFTQMHDTNNGFHSGAMIKVGYKF
ncbi:hypothetical protein [Persicobacter psychrovividus]|uniref:Outer membrane protein beta-barrel domain-containing protein n=1 Tax=Persicobacter psychrovividus TaxID=387638 RepID=A0ABM7VE75_9BACT|nr:hypothetical protein PEPS_15400 [Persicobacter psychrovividus]